LTSLTNINWVSAFIIKNIHTDLLSKINDPSAATSLQRPPLCPMDRVAAPYQPIILEDRLDVLALPSAVKRVISWQLAEAMRKKKKTKQALAKELNTSRSQLDRLLDPQNIAVSLDTVARAAKALGKRLIIRIADAKAG
jgi:antitoxin HicB